jgi:hypothetical protein
MLHHSSKKKMQEIPNREVSLGTSYPFANVVTKVVPIEINDLFFAVTGD